MNELFINKICGGTLYMAQTKKLRVRQIFNAYQRRHSFGS